MIELHLAQGVGISDREKVYLQLVCDRVAKRGLECEVGSRSCFTFMVLTLPDLSVLT